MLNCGIRSATWLHLQGDECRKPLIGQGLACNAIYGRAAGDARPWLWVRPQAQYTHADRGKG